jgi:hypothetical protein
MTKKRGCDICNHDFTEGTGAELKFKMISTSLWKMSDVCSTCMREKILPTFQNLKWFKYDKDNKKFLEYQGTVQE